MLYYSMMFYFDKYINVRCEGLLLSVLLLLMIFLLLMLVIIACRFYSMLTLYMLNIGFYTLGLSAGNAIQ